MTHQCAVAGLPRETNDGCFDAANANKSCVRVHGGQSSMFPIYPTTLEHHIRLAFSVPVLVYSCLKPNGFFHIRKIVLSYLLLFNPGWWVTPGCWGESLLDELFAISSVSQQILRWAEYDLPGSCIQIYCLLFCYCISPLCIFSTKSAFWTESLTYLWTIMLMLCRNADGRFRTRTW